MKKTKTLDFLKKGTCEYILKRISYLYRIKVGLHREKGYINAYECNRKYFMDAGWSDVTHFYTAIKSLKIKAPVCFDDIKIIHGILKEERSAEELFLNQELPDTQIGQILREIFIKYRGIRDFYKKNKAINTRYSEVSMYTLLNEELFLLVKKILGRT